MDATKKRKHDSDPVEQPGKRLRMTQKPPDRRINKLSVPKPFPTVAPSVNATGPRSSHREGVNMICITRKTGLGAYMRRCKKLILENGYKTLHLSAMGAAIPHLMQLLCSLPPILPFPQDEVRWAVKTGTVEVQDEVIPDDEDEDLSYQTRCKSTLRVVFTIGDGAFEGDRGPIRRYSAGKTSGPSRRRPQKGKGKTKESNSEIIHEEPEQEFMDMI